MKNKSRQRKPNLQQNGINKERDSTVRGEKETENRASIELVIFRSSFVVILIGVLVYGLYMYSVAKTPESFDSRTVVQKDNVDSFLELDSDIDDSEDGSASSREQQTKPTVKQEIPVILSERLKSGEMDTEKPLQSSKTDQAQKSTSSKSQSQNGGKSPKNKKQTTTPLSRDVTEIKKEVDNFKATYLKTMSPKKIFVDGRRLPPVELLPQKPNNSSVRVFLYDEFLSEQECDGLMRAHDSHVKESSKINPLICFDTIETLRKHLKTARKKVKVTPADFIPGTFCVNETFSRQLSNWLKSNWSYSTAFYPGESKFSKIFEYRVKEATQLLPENGGKFQITSYPQGIGYKTHTDCIEDNPDERDRMATILVYLQDVEDGGETKFPELGIWVKPRKGRALVWNNMNEDGKCEPLSIHNAAKVNKGHKYILQRWYYYKNFYSLGKRPPEPELPPRASGTPRVNCDEYEKGSCRWYDEWNYEHLVDYRNQRINLK